MVLIHKLKQVEGIDIQQLRELQNDHNSMAGHGEPKAQDRPRTNVEIQDSQTKSKTIPIRAITPHRPLTRSQTGHVPKRKSRDDSPQTNKPPFTAPRKRPKSTGPRKPPADDAEQAEDDLTPECATHASGVPSVGLDSVAQSQLSPNGDSSLQLTFLNTNPDGSATTDVIRRTPRSRVVLPTPVPNLTKKSRGRRVPTTTSPILSGDSRDGRLYDCKVEGCGKCFFRGEHLKRHIRSIHTHEKPYKCTYQDCEKLFNRHDNLLQHLKVHKEPLKRTRQSSSGSSNDTDQEDHVDDTATSNIITPIPVSPLVTPSQPLRFQDIYESATAVIHPTPPSHLPSTVISYTSIASYTASSPALSPEPLGFSTNMAVSSIRTEIPPSPRLRNSSKSMIPELL